jgi:hypothetical protein
LLIRSCPSGEILARPSKETVRLAKASREDAR